MKLNCHIKIGLPSPGESMETEWDTTTEVRDSQGKWHGGPETTFAMPSWKEGDQFAFRTKGGIFEGTVAKRENYTAEDSAETMQYASAMGGSVPAAEVQILIVSGKWDGREGTLEGGKTAFGSFQVGRLEWGSFKEGIDHETLVESSVYPNPVNYATYSAAKALAKATTSWEVENRPEAIQKSMGNVLSAALDRSHTTSSSTVPDSVREQIEAFCASKPSSATNEQERE